MVMRQTDEFEIAWKSPGDAQETWLFDPMHLPAPMCQLAADFWDRMFSRYMNSRTVYVNGYAFSTAPSPLPPSEDMLRRGVSDVWTNDFMPRIRATTERIRGRAYDAMALPEFAQLVPEIIAEAVTAFGLTMRPIAAFMGPTFGLVEFLRQEVGPDGPELGATLLQGFENGTAAAGAGLSELAEDAAQRPSVAAALREGTFDGLEALDGGAEFMQRFRRYLDDFGWRVDSWGFLERPTWSENPRLPLTLIAHYIADPQLSPAAAHRRSVQQREEAVREVESRLPAERLPEFRSMLAACERHVAISEGRALWQLIIVGSLRVPFLALGRRLVAAGALRTPEQVFFFDSDELVAAANHPTPDVLERANQREADFARWQQLKPPPFLGAPPDMSALPPEAVSLLTLFFGVAPPDVEGHQIRGQGASKGVVRARARVLHDLSEAERLQPGEILVCTTTAPPWTPLFAIASGVVTDSGGVLSHSAICAREYAIPCVVATQVATTVIRDGSMITIDGLKGIVQFED